MTEIFDLNGFYTGRAITFTYDDPDFAARMRVLPDYTVKLLMPDITAVTTPGHEDEI